MPSPKEFPERRKDHALRALYNRVEVLEKLLADQDKSIAILEEKSVTKNWLMGGLVVVAMGVGGGGYGFAKGLEENAAKPLKAQAETIAELGKKLDRSIENQTATSIKTEAMYLNTIERRPREEVREAVLRSTPPKEK